MTNAPQIHITNCSSELRGYFHEAGQIMCSIFQRAVQAYAAKLKFYPSQALPLVGTRFFRLVKISPMDMRSPARRPRDDRETSGRKSGVMSRALATTTPPSNRQDDSQDSLPCTERERAIAAPETCETACPNLNHDTPKI